VPQAEFNPPPNWPLPRGWTPDDDWVPDPSWPPAPSGWQFWGETHEHGHFEIDAATAALSTAVFLCYLLGEVLDLYLYRWVAFAGALLAVLIIVVCVAIRARRRESTRLRDIAEVLATFAIPMFLFITVGEFLDVYLRRWEAFSVSFAIVTAGTFAVAAVAQRRRSGDQ
jgi:hypothetical protein